MTVRQLIAVINAGSSSLKFNLYELGGGDDPQRVVKASIDGIGGRARLRVDDRYQGAAENGTGGGEAVEQLDVRDVDQAIDVVLGHIERWSSRGKLIAIGHRVVHGGNAFTGPVAVDDHVIAGLRALIPLAPLHQPHNLAPILALRERMPGVAQVACVDTSFHATIGELARRFAIPERFYRKGIRRYGFHGLSYEWIAERLRVVAPAVADGRVIVAHLGSGASLCAMHGGRSVDTTMGFTAMDGLPMATRPGQLDCGVVLHLLRQEGLDAEEVERLLYKECGLLGLSGISGDVRDLEASDSASARLALEFFAFQIGKAIGSLSAVLGGLDALVFTAGIGEHSTAVRAAVCERAGWLGVDLDPARNDAHETVIGTSTSRVAVLVLPTDEELMIARHARRLVSVS